MTQEQYPHSVHRWVGYIEENGPSNRPFPTDDSDLINPDSYSDPLEIKAERTALAAIIAIRAYQKARKILPGRPDILALPSTATITDPHVLLNKSKDIGVAFNSVMIECFLEDEKYLKKSPNHPAAAVYQRLNNILEPVTKKLYEGKKDEFLIEDTGELIEHPSPVFSDEVAGLAALPGNILMLQAATMLEWGRVFGQYPTVQKSLEIMGNSYGSFIRARAALHKADIPILEHLGRQLLSHGIMSGSHQLHNNSIRILPEVMDAINQNRQMMKDALSQHARCAFLVSAKSAQAFLDEPADFEEPLEDAFNLYMKLLAA